MSDDIVIIGAGQAGTRAALTIAGLDPARKVTVIGDEACIPYERPPLSKGYLLGTQQLHEFPIDRARMLENSGVEVIQGQAVLEIDRSSRMVRLADGRNLSFQQLLLATGRSARTLTPATALSTKARTLRSATDAAAIREEIRAGSSALVIGGGLIGLEVAAGAAAKGMNVAVVEAGDRLMARAVPPEISTYVLAHHRSRGIDIMISANVPTTGPGGWIALSNGWKARPDLVLLAIGSIPNIDLASKAGILVDRGIIVDRSLRTSDPAIFAAGDVVEMRADGQSLLFENWTAADAQGALAARNMLGACEEWTDASWFWSDQGDLSIQGAGQPAAHATIVRSYPDGIVVFTLSGTGTVAGVFAAGSATVMRDVRYGQQLIDGRRIAPPAELADATMPLRNLVKRYDHNG